MPIRFQVDADFYDHPKTTGMSDAAFSLWVRAGSFSAAKLTDGYVSEDVLVITLRSDGDVAGELVRRGLWRRVKGGFKFHEWSERNLTKQRVQTDKEADRERKRREREATRKAPRQKAKPQEEAEIVRSDSGGIPDGIDPESDRNPGSSVSVSVSVSESESVSGSGRGDGQQDAAGTEPHDHDPTPKCSDHQDHPDPPPCGRCKDARLAAEARQREHDQAAQAAADAATLAAIAARSADIRNRAEANRAAIARCTRCNQHGQVNGKPCTHDPAKADRARRGAALARAALPAKPEPSEDTP